MENVKITFVVPGKYNNKNDCSEVMHSAFEACSQNVNIDVCWTMESKFKTQNVTKNDFVVFEKFEGTLFEELKNTKSTRIVGPWAVNICLVEGKSIPNYNWPIYNVAMYNCIITCTHLSKNIKMEVKEKVQLMGGCYVDSLLEKNTHLIAGSAKSEKYLVAAEAGVKLMCLSWVEEVWQISQTVNIHADDEQFKKHRCPVFHNLIISSTGITNPKQKRKLESLIKENGGSFTGKLNVSNTDILVCSGDVINSEKYRAARQNQVKCVDMTWITDSYNKGYALPLTSYQVQKITSTPTKVDKFVNPEFSILSAIGGPNTSQQTWVEESVAAAFPMDGDNIESTKRKAKGYCEDLINNLDIKKVKRAGQYLDGCSVYLTGFSPDHTEKLNKIINLSGATRYDTTSERLTHIIIGDPNSHEVILLKNKHLSAVLVSINWLVDSIEQQHPVNEDKYLISSGKENIGLGSPLSKKGLSLLRANRTATEKELETTNLNNEDNKMDSDFTPINFTSPNVSDTLGKLLEAVDNPSFSKQLHQIHELPAATPQFKPSETSTQQSSMSVTQDAESEVEKVFLNIRFLILGFDEEEFEKLKESVTELGAEVVPKTYKGIPEYALVPMFNQNELHNTASEVVNDYFINDCIREGELILSPDYYHRPIDIPDSKPIKNCVVTISGYCGTERAFLKNLIEALGGLSQEQFSRIRQDAKSLLPSTHLVCPEASGKKYEAALKWKLPVVSKDWLLECARTGKKVDEGDYLLGSKGPDDLVDKTPQQMKSLIQQEKPKSTANASTGPSGARLLTSVSPVAPHQNRFLNTTEPDKGDGPEVEKARSMAPSYDSPRPSTSSGTHPSTPGGQVTPYHRRFLNSAEKFSQVTPVNKIMKQFREGNVNNPATPEDTKEYTVPPPWAFVKTPNTPLGAFCNPNPSPNTRKYWEYWLGQFPDDSPNSNKSTPLSDLKRQLRSKVERINSVPLHFEDIEDDKYFPIEDAQAKEVTNVEFEETSESQYLPNKIQQIEDMLSASGCGKRQSRNFQSTIPVPAGTAEFRDSQPCTVGWDFRSQEVQQPQTRNRVFSLSGVADDSERARMQEQLEQLGGTVTSSANYDPSCTHLICPKAARNEKSLSCMASGKWILHTSYIDKSMEAGHFLNEEDYEFGNPKAVGNFPSVNDRESELRMQMMHWWRKEVSRRGYGAFNDMRAIVIAIKRDPIVRVIEAGGGVVVDFKPPFEDTIYATHCLLEHKSVKRIEDYIPLAKQGIFLVNTIYISEHLHQPTKDIRDCILPYFSKYYGRSS